MPVYEDMDTRKKSVDNKEFPHFFHNPYRRRSSTFPGASGGAILATEVLSSPSVYSFREQGTIPVLACCPDREACCPGMETYCPTIGEKFAPNYLCTQHCQAASIPWKKIPSESNYSHKSSSKLKILLNIALFLLAAVTGM